MTTINWIGQGGRVYVYTIHMSAATLSTAPGNYVVARQNEDGRFQPVYAGEAENIRDSLASHERWPCFRSERATHITVNVRWGGARTRRDEETDIRARWNPSCNRQ